MRILLAPDAFKGSLSAIEVAQAMARGIAKIEEGIETVQLPVADGGEGTMDALVAATGGRTKEVAVKDLLGRPHQATYGVLGDGATCVIEIAQVVGLPLLTEDQRAPVQTTTYGIGQLIQAALKDGFTSFIMALGGSATNDGGAGMLQALGMKLQDEDGVEIPLGGGGLSQLHTIDCSNFDARLADCDFLIASDVKNPFVGAEGATYTFGPQKGATASDLELLEANMCHFANVIERTKGLAIHSLEGAGAAGGLGGAFSAFFPSEMAAGIDVVLQHSQFDRALEKVDLVLTGEGRVDAQTSYGKTPFGVAKAAQLKNIPSIILAGSVATGIERLYAAGVISVHSIVRQPMSIAEAMEDAAALIETTTEQIIRTYRAGMQADAPC